MINTNTDKTVWPEAGTLAAVVLRGGDGISQAIDRLIDEVAVGERKRVGFIQQRLGGEELVKRIISVSAQAHASRSTRGWPTSDEFVAMTDPQIISLRLPAGKNRRLSEVTNELLQENAVDSIVIVETLPDAGALEAEVPLLKNQARSSGVGITLIFSEDGNGVGAFPAELASEFDRVS